MDRKKTGLAALALVLLLAAAGCATTPFQGDAIVEEDRYQLTFEVLNCKDTHVFSLNEGDAMDVEIAVSSGSIDLTVTGPDGNEIYRGNNAENGAFQLSIPSAGDYSCAVTGRTAKGSVIFTVQRKDK